MRNQQGLSRRGLLRTAALAAGGVMLSGCSGSGGSGSSGGGGDRADPDKVGSHIEPLKPPKNFDEAPMLKKLVDSGELPPVAERLPESPYVPPHKWLTTGKYGGRMRLITRTSDEANIGEYSYGHSLLRYLNDGADIGPGLVERWDHNSDHTEWKLYFRKGLKWSDGEPWSTADVMHWWEDLCLNTEYPEAPPDDLRSGKDTRAELTAEDDTTVVIRYDAPAPAAVEKIAAWVNRSSGPSWMQPLHYMRKYHPKYTDGLGKGWSTKYEQVANWKITPDCPTMTGWVCKDYEEGRAVRMERNPYFWVVDSEGNQLPYLDEVQWSVVPDQTQLVHYTQGKADFAQQYHTGLNLSEVPDLRSSTEDTGLEVWFWDSGSGTGSMAIWNHDHPDKKYRDLFRDKRFRQALSHAMDRKRIRKNIYYNNGELTTGTLSPKGVIFGDSEGKKRYREWRDSYIEHNPDKAKKLLDEIGLVDSDGDGFREFPDGSKLRITLDHSGTAIDEHIQKNNMMAEDWAAVGIDTRPNPVSADGFGDRWGRGELMVRSDWSADDNHPLLYPGWVIPVTNEHWAPLHGQGWVQTTADPDGMQRQLDTDPWQRKPPFLLPEEGSVIDRLWKLYNQARVESDDLKRTQLLWDVVKIHVEEGPFWIGSVANYPRIILVHRDMRNVPRKQNLAKGGWVNPWIVPTPAVYDPETWFWSNPDEHA